MESEGNESGFERDHLKAMEAAGRVVELCHKRLFASAKPLELDEMKKLVFCLREAWLMSSSQAQIVDPDKMDGSSDDGDDDDETPPHPLR